MYAAAGTVNLITSLSIFQGKTIPKAQGATSAARKIIWKIRLAEIKGEVGGNGARLIMTFDNRLVSMSRSLEFCMRGFSDGCPPIAGEVESEGESRVCKSTREAFTRELSFSLWLECRWNPGKNWLIWFVASTFWIWAHFFFLTTFISNPAEKY